MKKHFKILLSSALLIGLASCSTKVQLGNIKFNASTSSTQVKTQSKLVGNNPDTYTPKYLSVKDFKKCLEVQVVANWDQLCIPAKRLNNCPVKSWNKLKNMDLKPC